MYKAVVFGSTGATGREVVTELVNSGKWSEVKAVTRRVVPHSEWLGGGATSEKLKVHVSEDMTNSDTYSEAVKDATAVYYCLGTTRADAGSGKALADTELGMIKGVTEVSSAAGVKGFSLVSSQGASSSSLFNYMKVKGQIEDRVKAANFPFTSIFQPGLLGRGNKARTVEKICSWVMPTMPAKTLARAMVLDMEKKLGAGSPSSGVEILGNKAIHQLVK